MFGDISATYLGATLGRFTAILLLLLVLLVNSIFPTPVTLPFTVQYLQYTYSVLT